MFLFVDVESYLGSLDEGYCGWENLHARFAYGPVSRAQVSKRKNVMEAMSAFEYVPAGLVRFVRETETECDCFTPKKNTGVGVCSRQVNHEVVSV